MTDIRPIEPLRRTLAGVTLGMISWKAPRTVAATLASYERAQILDLFAGKLIHFNEISDADREIAARFGFTVSGSDENLGIFGAVDTLARQATTPYYLAVENDCPLLTDRAGFIAMMTSALADMAALDIPVFSVRSRRQPGDKFVRRSRYEKRFRIVWPIGSQHSGRRTMSGLLQRTYEDARRSSLRGSAIFAEEDPSLRHPSIIKRTPNGNWLTSSPYLSWSNNSVLVRTDFLRDVVLDHVRRFPSKTRLNGQQDIEAALKENQWWRRQNILIGQSEPGPFTHQRLDR